MESLVFRRAGRDGIPCSTVERGTRIGGGSRRSTTPSTKRLGGDNGRKERALAERAFLHRELAKAVGIGGRQRRTPAATERQRINVTRTVKAVIQKIGQVDRELGRHLAASVRTGTFCVYATAPGLRHDWNVSW